jgi:S-DNA-T family DNA segregation ATPase FtsK/SpoIIIE
MSKKNNNKAPKNFTEAIGLRKPLNNEKTDFLLGLVLLLFSVYLTTSMISFCFTASADQSLLEQLRPGDWMNSDHEFQNICGSVGAILSYFLIAHNFGFPAFAIPVFLILVGLKLTKAYTVNLLKWFFGLTLFMVWLSVAMAKFLAPIMPSSIFNPGGDNGAYCVTITENVVGAPGLIAILVFVAIAFLTFVSTETINVVRKTLHPTKSFRNKVKFTLTNLNTSAKTDDAAANANVDDATDITDDEPMPVNEEEPSPVVDLTPGINEQKPVVAEPKPEPKPTVTNAPVSDGNLTIETAKETEKANGNKITTNADDFKTEINPKEPFLNYKYPTLDLLKKYDNDGKPEIDMAEIKANNERIIEVLRNFGVEIKDIRATVGPTITLYELTPKEGVRISKIRNLEDDIALSLAALGIRIIAPIPGKGTIGIEVPNKKPNIVSMESIINSKKFQETKMELPLALGKTITNDVFMVDLAKIPHLLVAGATGQGKSVGLNAIITSLLYKKHPNELKIVLVDPKKVEFSVYSPIADHFMATVEDNEDEPIITDVTKVVHTLNSLCALMDHRYDLLKIAGARNIKEYNAKWVNHRLNPEKGHDYMPYIVVVIDEYGDLIMTAGKEIEAPITRIAQLARAVGIHMIIATQRPTTNIITGSIKANFPGRMAFKVSSMIDSRTILDRPGANQLVGRGDMLFLNGNEPVRVQCAFVDTPEIEAINDYVAHQPGPVEPMELPEPAVSGSDGMGGGAGSSDIQSLDPYFEEAAHAIVTTQQGSTSMIQRRFSIGYNRAGRLMDQLEAAGIVGPSQGSKPRDVLIQDENTLAMKIAQIRG